MVFTALYNGKQISVTVTAGNNSLLQDIEDVIITFDIPEGLAYQSSILPQGDFISNSWEIGTLTANTTISSVINFVVTDVSLFTGNNVPITWTISSPNVVVDLDPSNNSNEYIIIPAPCAEIEECVGCGLTGVIYNCKSKTNTLTLQNTSSDILENIKVYLTSPSSFLFKTASVTLGSANLGLDPDGNLTIINVNDLSCVVGPGANQYYQYITWNIPTFPANSSATLTFTNYIVNESEYDPCSKITWIVDNADGPLDGLQGIYNLKGSSGNDLVTSTGYKEWLGRFIYLASPTTIDGILYGTGLQAVPYNRNTYNYLGNFVVDQTSTFVFQLSSATPLFYENMIATSGIVGTSSPKIQTLDYISSTLMEFEVDIDSLTTINIPISLKFFV